MGLKSLSLQMLPWCFHMVTGGHDDACANSARSADPIRLVGSDGRVIVYNRPVSAAELMREHPSHLICRSDSFFIGQKVPALSAGERLQPGQSYFILPSQFFHSVLSFVSLASSLLVANSTQTGAGKNKMPALRPFDIQKTAAGTLQIRVCDEFLVDDGKVKEEVERRGRVCSSAELEKEYKELCCRVNKWRPRLDVVVEGVERRRKGRGNLGFLVFSGGFGRRGRRRRRED